MTALFLAGMLALPIAPINPVAEDTLRTSNLHFTVGVTTPNGIVSMGPEVSIKYEMLAVHPLLLRSSLDFKYARTISNLFPKGDLMTTSLAADAIYYRGTHRLMGYMGAGVIYSFHNFISSQETADSLWTTEQIHDVDMDPKWGYRLTLGLRIHKSYSFEIGVTEMRPFFVKWGTAGERVTTRTVQQTRTGGFRLSFGYLFPISLL